MLTTALERVRCEHGPTPPHVMTGMAFAVVEDLAGEHVPGGDEIAQGQQCCGHHGRGATQSHQAISATDH